MVDGGVATVRGLPVVFSSFSRLRIFHHSDRAHDPEEDKANMKVLLSVAAVTLAAFTVTTAVEVAPTFNTPIEHVVLLMEEVSEMAASHITNARGR